ncbi:hypothetical protein V1478_012100 [Vespula squamosa]|uniref:Uncharacterized protein n=1 Tax=Vespula squamosa TaxID=30214 RepID=A0ABD2AC91_VESSQ
MDLYAPLDTYQRLLIIHRAAEVSETPLRLYPGPRVASCKTLSMGSSDEEGLPVFKHLRNILNASVRGSLGVHEMNVTRISHYAAQRSF